ncbi:hypothetical protein [Sorangium sp. So ce1024]|uniref:hypothetical protein n=1 Tax=Sorangium sp. So ce1024 TaxID=3133327 RepID=UPI003F0E7C92
MKSTPVLGGRAATARARGFAHAEEARATRDDHTTEASHGTRRKGYLWAAVVAAAALVGCAPVDDRAPEVDDRAAEGAAEGEVEVAESEEIGVAEQGLATRLWARQELKIRGAFNSYTSYFTVPSWSTTDEHPDPITVPGIRRDGRCSEGYVRDTATAEKTAGNGDCSFAGWLSPGDPTDCRAEIRLKHSAGGDNIWNGACLVKIYEKPALVRANSCLNRCGQYNVSAPCQCDRSCGYHGDCCPDANSVCF